MHRDDTSHNKFNNGDDTSDGGRLIARIEIGSRHGWRATSLALDQ